MLYNCYNKICERNSDNNCKDISWCNSCGNRIKEVKQLTLEDEIKVRHEAQIKELKNNINNLRQIVNEKIYLNELMKLREVAKLYSISNKFLESKLKYLKEGEDYLKLGERQPTLLTRSGRKKLLNIMYGANKNDKSI